MVRDEGWVGWTRSQRLADSKLALVFISARIPLVTEVMVTSLLVPCSPEAGETVPLDTLKMLKLAEQCLERAQSTAATLGASPVEGFPGAFPPSLSPL